MYKLRALSNISLSIVDMGEGEDLHGALLRSSSVAIYVFRRRLRERLGAGGREAWPSLMACS